MIPKTLPVAGTVLRFSYLWKREARSGRTEANKDRPVALVVALAAADGECVVVPITHTPPQEPDTAIEIPASQRAKLGLDDEPAWIVLNEFNSFFWPGYDLRPVPGRRPPTAIYGMISTNLYKRVITRLRVLLRERRATGVPRS